MGTYSKEWLTEHEWRQVKGIVLNRQGQNTAWRDELMLKTLYNGAFRVSELVGNETEKDPGEPYQKPVMWTDDYEEEIEKDVDGNIKKRRYYIVVRTSKTEEDAQLQPINGEIYRETKRFMESKSSSTRIVFDNGRGSSLSRQRVNDILQDYVDEAGIDKKCGSHTLRRSRAKHLLENGVDLSKVSRFLRHDRIKTTMKYLNLSKKHLSDEVGEVDDHKKLV